MRIAISGHSKYHEEIVQQIKDKIGSNKIVHNLNIEDKSEDLEKMIFEVYQKMLIAHEDVVNTDAIAKQDNDFIVESETILDVATLRNLFIVQILNNIESDTDKAKVTNDWREAIDLLVVLLKKSIHKMYDKIYFVTDSDNEINQFDYDTLILYNAIGYTPIFVNRKNSKKIIRQIVSLNSTYVKKV